MTSAEAPVVRAFAGLVLVATFDTGFFVGFTFVFLTGLGFAVAAFFRFTGAAFVVSHSPFFVIVFRIAFCFAAFVVCNTATFVSSRKGNRTTNFGLDDDNIFGASSPRTK